MAVREGVPDGEPEVRKHLTAEWHDSYATYVNVALEGSVEFGRYTHDALHPKLAALESGAAVEFRRMELPPGHPLADMPRAGDPTDRFELGSDDVLRRR